MARVRVFSIVDGMVTVDMERETDVKRMTREVE